MKELAGYLRIKPLTIYRYAIDGRLPGFKVGSRWRFKKGTIDQWIRTQETVSNNKKTLVNA
ncbi:MAG: helix-turn-helix domain-containing protein [Candidatus Omnitrophota bacterium]